MDAAASVEQVETPGAGGDVTDAASDLTPLMVSARAGKLDELLKCIGAGASVFARDARGATALHHAAGAADAALLCQALLDRGARADTCDDEGRLPADMAIDSNVRELLTVALEGQYESDGYDSGVDDRPWH